MSFGFANALGVFQALVNNVSRDFLNIFVFVYLNDIPISPEEHRVHVCSVLQRLLENRLFVKAEKCEFDCSLVIFLGYILAGGQVTTDRAKIQAVSEWPTSSSKKQLQRFLRFTNFYHRFILNYSPVAAQLTPKPKPKSAPDTST